MRQLFQPFLAILFTSIWINASEFLRNEIILKNQWGNHYNSLGIIFPSEPFNVVIWVIWGILFSTSIYIISRKFNIIQTSFISWFMGFVLMWLVTWNLRVLPISIFIFAIPLSLLETFIGTYICRKFSFQASIKYT
jgi:hypothetical protein